MRFAPVNYYRVTNRSKTQWYKTKQQSLNLPTDVKLEQGLWGVGHLFTGCQLGCLTGGWRTYFQEGVLTWPANWCRLLAGELSQAEGQRPRLLCTWASLWAAWASSQHGGWVSRASIPKDRKWKPPISYGLAPTKMAVSQSFYQSRSYRTQIQGEGTQTPISQWMGHQRIYRYVLRLLQGCCED